MILNTFAGAFSKDDELYNALNVEEVYDNPGIAGAYRLVKKAGNLKCYKGRVVIPNAIPTYDCVL